jgi:cytochrome P450
MLCCTDQTKSRIPTMPYLPPPHAIAAVTHPDPYPYYAELVAHQPLYYDASLKMWVASSAAAVRAVLTSPLVRVRPVAEPVPTALLNSPAAAIFRHLIRMNDGAGHCPFKNAVSSAVETIAPAQLKMVSHQCARMLMAHLQPSVQPEHLTDFAFQLSVYVVATLLGVPQDRLPEVTGWVDDFVRGIAPASPPEQLEQGNAAAQSLLTLLHALLAEQKTNARDSLLTHLAKAARNIGCDDANIIVANAIGLLMQPYEATAGLIGNALVLLAAHPTMRAQITGNWTLIPALLQEVLRADAPVQNTRRFVAEAGIIAGCEVQAGDMILVVLAAANYDPAANSNPQHFDLFRQNRQIFTFGSGVHACPGEVLATSIAQVALEQLLATDFEFALSGYRPSANIRIPLWQIREEVMP